MLEIVEDEGVPAKVFNGLIMEKSVVDGRQLNGS
jgi:hypothetical protein